MLRTKSWARSVSLMCTFLASTIMALTTGCVSGGFQLTRSYATWVNSTNVVIRVILYIFTFVVFFVTILIDLVVNNTEDFWNGTVSQGIYQFHRDGKTYTAHHEVLPDTKLKQSTIRVTDSHDKLLQEVVLKETVKGEIELYVDGRLRTRVKSISKAPVAYIFDRDGRKIEERIIPLNTAFAAK